MGPLLACAVLVLATAGRAQVRNYSAAQADTILAEVHRALLEYHPFAHRGNGRARLDSAYAALRASLPAALSGDSVDQQRLIVHAAGFNRLIGDGHLQLRPVLDSVYLRLRDRHAYGLHTRHVRSGAYVLLDSLYLSDSTLVPRGAEWIGLDGRDAGEVVAELGAFFGVDDHGNAAARELYPAYSPMTYYQRVYGLLDSVAARFEVDGALISGFLVPHPREVGGEASGRRERRRRRRARLARGISLDTTAAAGIYALSIRSFSKSGLGSANAYRRVRRLFARLDSLDARGLVIDVRNNTGGSADLVDHVFGFIADERYALTERTTGHSRRAKGRNIFERSGNVLIGGVRPDGEGGYYVKRAGKTKRPKARRRRFTGPVVVLVNEITFSGGTVLAHYVQHYRRGLVVGQVPGGSAERMYARDLFEVYVGPDDELRINMPLWYMDMIGEARGNVRPDVVVPRTRADILAERDAALEVAIELLQSE